MDRITPDQRSRNMRAIRSKHTTPEVIVRKVAFGLGYRFRLHDRQLPGKPDLVFASRRKVIFVHGCFWHQHQEGCADARQPKSNQGYWLPKLQRNIARDADHAAQLAEMGWKVLVIWACEIKDLAALERSLRKFLGRRRQLVHRRSR